MKAIVQDSYGSEEVLELREIEPPTIADDEVQILVHAAGVDRGVWHLMSGLPYPIRLAGFGVRRPRSPVIRADVAGVVTQIGGAVTRFAPGDEVFGIGQCGFAEYAKAREDKLAPKPVDLTFCQAAALPVSGLTALHALRDSARVQPGHTVLVVGASGGVGSYAVQIAKAFGAHVTGVCSTTKVDLVRSLGADDVLDYTSGDDFADRTRHFDVLLDVGGNSSLTRLRRALAPRGKLVIVGGEGGGRWLGGTDRLLRAPLLSPFVSQQLKVLQPDENHQDLVVLTELVAAGKVMPAIDRSYPLGELPKAIRSMVEGNVRGKVVITV